MIISSTEKKQWQAGETSEKQGFKLETGSEKQTIRGFGTCFSELGAVALGKLSDNDKKAAFDELFDSDKCNFNYCRTPIGANDFSLDFYSYNENDGDY